MMTKDEALRKIEELKAYVAEQDSLIKPSDIVPGRKFRNSYGTVVTVLRHGYGAGTYGIGGLSSNPFEFFSDFGESGLTAKEAAHYFNRMGYTAVA